MGLKHGVIPQNYLTDEGVSFTSNKYNEDLSRLCQLIRHAAPGAHHANGIAERSIATVMLISRAMLHHAAIHWPNVAMSLTLDAGQWLFDMLCTS